MRYATAYAFPFLLTLFCTPSFVHAEPNPYRHAIPVGGVLLRSGAEEVLLHEHAMTAHCDRETLGCRVKISLTLEVKGSTQLNFSVLTSRKHDVAVEGRDSGHKSLSVIQGKLEPVAEGDPARLKIHRDQLHHVPSHYTKALHWAHFLVQMGRGRHTIDVHYFQPYGIHFRSYGLFSGLSDPLFSFVYDNWTLDSWPMAKGARTSLAVELDQEEPSWRERLFGSPLSMVCGLTEGAGSTKAVYERFQGSSRAHLVYRQMVSTRQRAPLKCTLVEQ